MVKKTRYNENLIIRKEEIYGNKKIFSECNKVWISGVIEEEFDYSHEVFGERFYKTKVRVTRLSGAKDLVPILVSGFLMPNFEGLKGKYVELGGQFRSHNKVGEDGLKHLNLFVFVTTINVCDEEEFEDTNANVIYLDGYICKPPVYRTTPLGRQIADLLIAVNRNYNKSDYIPTIAWGRLAQYASEELQVGARIKLWGAIQSRQYVKKRFSQDSEGETRIAYEVSIKRMMLDR